MRAAVLFIRVQGDRGLGAKRSAHAHYRGDFAPKDPSGARRQGKRQGGFAPKDPRMRTTGGTSRQKIRACALQGGLRAKRSARCEEAREEGRGPLGTSERRRESTAHEANRRRKQDRGGGSGEFRHIFLPPRFEMSLFRGVRAHTPSRKQGTP